MSKRDELIKRRLREAAQLSDTEIITRSVLTGALFVLLLLGLDLLLNEPIEIYNTLMIGFIFTGILALYDLILRASARKQLK